MASNVTGTGEQPAPNSSETSAEEMMQRKNFYTDAEKYWERIPATVNGVMGGFQKLSAKDTSASRKLILSFTEGPEASISNNRALDCGAGIGRVSKHLLLPLFKEVDLVEMNQSFLDRAQRYLGEAAKRVGQYYHTSLQNFTPQSGHYDVIWCQWVLSHLRNDDLIQFLSRCVCGLVSSDRGIVFIKENIALGDEDVFDDEDSSVTRCMNSFLTVFQKADLTVAQREMQLNWPENMFQVYTFALRPARTDK